MTTRRLPRSGWPARARSIVTYSHSWPASRIAPAAYRGYGAMYGGTPTLDGSSTYPSRTTTFMGRNPCRRGDKRASPVGLLVSPAAYDDDEDDHHDGQDDGGDRALSPTAPVARGACRAQLDVRRCEATEHDVVPHQRDDEAECRAEGCRDRLPNLCHGELLFLRHLLPRGAATCLPIKRAMFHGEGPRRGAKNLKCPPVSRGLRGCPGGTNRGDPPRYRRGLADRPRGWPAYADRPVLRRRRGRVAQAGEPPATRGVQDPGRVEPNLPAHGRRTPAWREHDQLRKPRPRGGVGRPTARDPLHGPRPRRRRGPENGGDSRPGCRGLAVVPVGPHRCARARDVAVLALRVPASLRPSRDDRRTGDDRPRDRGGPPRRPDGPRARRRRRTRLRNRNGHQRTRASGPGVRGPGGRRRAPSGVLADPPIPSDRSPANDRRRHRDRDDPPADGGDPQSRLGWRVRRDGCGDSRRDAAARPRSEDRRGAGRGRGLRGVDSVPGPTAAPGRRGGLRRQRGSEPPRGSRQVMTLTVVTFPSRRPGRPRCGRSDIVPSSLSRAASPCPTR